MRSTAAGIAAVIALGAPVPAVAKEQPRPYPKPTRYHFPGYRYCQNVTVRGLTALVEVGDSWPFGCGVADDIARDPACDAVFFPVERTGRDKGFAVSQSCAIGGLHASSIFSTSAWGGNEQWDRHWWELGAQNGIVRYLLPGCTWAGGSADCAPGGQAANGPPLIHWLKPRLAKHAK